MLLSSLGCGVLLISSSLLLVVLLSGGFGDVCLLINTTLMATAATATNARARMMRFAALEPNLLPQMDSENFWSNHAALSPIIALPATTSEGMPSGGGAMMLGSDLVGGGP